MRLQEVDVGIEVEGLGSPIAAPILKIVPGVRSVQDENGAARILKIVRIAGNYKRPRRVLDNGAWARARTGRGTAASQSMA